MKIIKRLSYKVKCWVFIKLPARGPPTSQLLSPAVASIARNHQVTSIAMLQAQHHTSASLAQDKIEEDKEVCSYCVSGTCYN